MRINVADLLRRVADKISHEQVVASKKPPTSWMEDPARQQAATYWSQQTLAKRRRLSWGDFRTIRHHITTRIADREMYSISGALLERAQTRYELAFPLQHAVSIGAGTASKELSLAMAGYVSHWDCFDLSNARIEAGRRKAEEKGFGENMRFRQEDAFQAACPEYDMVFWSQSLHHMFDIGEAIDWSIAHLKSGGVFVMDEFVGPNRFQWTDEMLRAAKAARDRLEEWHLVIPEAPEKRFPRVMPRPSPDAVAKADPTESACSEEILGQVQARLPGADIVQLGGVIYHVALSGILTNFTEEDEVLLSDLLAYDAELAEKGLSVMAACLWQKP